MVSRKAVVIPFLILLSSHVNSRFEIVSYLSLALFLSLMPFFIYKTIYAVSRYQYFTKGVVVLLFISVSYVFYGFISSFYFGNIISGVKVSYQFFIVIMAIVYFYSLGSAGREINMRFLYFSIFIFYILAFLYLMASNDFGSFRWLFINPNGFGALLVPFSLLLISYKLERNSKFLFFYITFCLFLVLSSGARSSILALLIGISLLLIPLSILRSRLFKSGFLIFLIASPFIIIYLTVFLDFSNYASDVRELTGKNLESGRGLIWSFIIKSLNNDYMFGFGVGSSLSDITYMDLSAHNLYLQILFQSGLIGLLLVFFFFLTIYRLIYTISSASLFKLSLALFSSMLFVQNFEVMALQNNVTIFFIVWAVIGISLGNTKYKSSINSI